MARTLLTQAERGPLVRRERLGDLLNYYYREAAGIRDDSIMEHYGMPASVSFRIATIWVSVKRDFFIRTSWGNLARKLYS